MSSKGYYYLCTPYTKYAHGLGRAFTDACEQTALLLRAGHAVFSPIVHSHPLSIHGAMAGQTDFEAWRRLDEAMMEASRGLIICKLRGWDQSYGVKQEGEFAERIGKPIIFMDPDTIPAELA